MIIQLHLIRIFQILIIFYSLKKEKFNVKRLTSRKYLVTDLMINLMKKIHKNQYAKKKLRKNMKIMEKLMRYNSILTFHILVKNLSKNKTKKAQIRFYKLMRMKK